MEIKTKRLRIIALNLENLKLKITNCNAMEENLNLNLTNSAPLEGPIRNAFECMVRRVEENQENYAWFTNWEIVLTDENRSIGGICIKGSPNANGDVEIGYGTEPDYMGKGVMTEAVKGIVAWIFECPKVIRVVAETDKINRASQRVLEKNGMQKMSENKGQTWWALSKSDYKNEKRMEKIIERS